MSCMAQKLSGEWLLQLAQSIVIRVRCTVQAPEVDEDWTHFHTVELNTLDLKKGIPLNPTLPMPLRLTTRHRYGHGLQGSICRRG